MAKIGQMHVEKYIDGHIKEPFFYWGWKIVLTHFIMAVKRSENALCLSFNIWSMIVAHAMEVSAV